jgi:hypothetical protein
MKNFCAVLTFATLLIMIMVHFGQPPVGTVKPPSGDYIFISIVLPDGTPCTVVDYRHHGAAMGVTCDYSAEKATP